MKKILLLILMLFFVGITNTYASNYDEEFYAAEWINNIYINKVKSSKIYYKQARFIRKKSDNGIAYCIEPFEEMKYNSKYNAYTDNYPKRLGLSDSKWRQISLIAYYGYGYEGHLQDKWYAITQVMIWRVIDENAEFYFTDSLNGKKIDLYDSEMKEIETLVAKHNKVPSFAHKEYNFSINSTNILTDSGNVLKDYRIVSKSDNLDVSISNNKLTIKTNDISNSFIKFERKSNYGNPTIVFVDADYQNLLTPGSVEKIIFDLNINVIAGNIKIQKLDYDTGLPKALGEGKLIGSVYEIFDSSGQLVDILTIDDNYQASSKKLPFGKYIVKEKTSMEGYELDDNKYEVIIDEKNAIHELKLKNRVIKSTIELYKYYDDALESGVSFEIYNSTGELVKKVTTDEYGKISVELPFGTYFFHQLNSIKNYKCVEDFSITIDNETPKIKRINLYDEKFYSKLKIIKQDSVTGEIIRDEVIFKIFDLLENKYIQINGSEELKALDGILLINRIEAGNYYLEEVKSPKGYVLNNEKIFFRIDDENIFTYEEDIPVFEIKVMNTKEREILEVSVPNTSQSYQVQTICLIEEKKKRLF
ncbi:MAG: SpaA isopeptide-forming pilin-related protein [Bacilli bacterium]